MTRHPTHVLMFAFFASLLMISTSSFSAQIAKVKGKSVLINTEGDPMRSGDIFFAVGLDGKRKGIVRIAKVKGSKAIGQISKGSAQPGMSMMKYTKGSGKSSSTSTADYSSPEHSSLTRGSSTSSSGSAWGGMLGFASDSLTADIVTDAGVQQGSASTTGMAFSGSAMFDYRLFDRVWFRGLGGIEMFKTSGPSQCGTGGTSSCDVDLMYISLNSIGRYLFSEGNMRPWLGGGVALLFPMSKKSSLLQGSSITSTYAFIFTGGVDWDVSPRMYVPLSIEYGMLPKSDTVEASWIQFRAGLAFPF